MEGSVHLGARRRRKPCYGEHGRYKQIVSGFYGLTLNNSQFFFFSGSYRISQIFHERWTKRQWTLHRHSIFVRRFKRNRTSTNVRPFTVA